MRIFSPLFCAVAMAAAPAFAGAWTQDKGNGELIVTGSYYHAGSFYDNGGRKQSQPPYSQYALNPYFEYGLWNGVTAGANLSLPLAEQNGAYGGSNWGLGDSEFFLRARLWQCGGFVLSAEPMIKLPSPEQGSAVPPLGGSHPDIGLKFAAGYGFGALGQHHFVDIGTQYRYRFGSPKDQANSAATLGIGLSPRWMILPQAFLTLRTSAPRANAFTQSPANDYDLLKLQLSALYKVTDSLSLQAGGFSEPWGKNTGAGNGVVIAVWKRL